MLGSRDGSGGSSQIPWFDHPHPFPWQVRIYREFCRGLVREEPLYLPTGTGKTSVALLYLLALLEGAPLPRRLVYIVDRRAIVDQTRDRIATWVRRLASRSRIPRSIAWVELKGPGHAGLEDSARRIPRRAAGVELKEGHRLPGSVQGARYPPAYAGVEFEGRAARRGHTGPGGTCRSSLHPFQGRYEIMRAGNQPAPPRKY